MMKIYLDAGTTWSKIIATEQLKELQNYFYNEYISACHSEGVITTEESAAKRFLASQSSAQNDKLYYYILPSSELKKYNLDFTKTTGHMTGREKPENEIIALTKGILGKIDDNALVLDLGSRDAKWIKLKDGKFFDLDWNTSCAAATGATVEMLLKFYDLKADELKFNAEKYPITCGIFGLEKIMDDISNGVNKKEAVAKFIHGIAFNAWKFAKKPDKIYLSGGFCQNECFVKSLSKYCEVEKLGRFVLVEGLLRD